MNKEELINLRDVLDKEIKNFDDLEKKEYELLAHKDFEIGDWVTNGDNIGVVKWVKNLTCGMPEDKGYFGLSIRNNDGGFIGGARRNDYSPIPKESLKYYTTLQTLTLTVTGEEVEAFFMSYHSMKKLNPSKLKTKLIEAFESLRPF